MYRLLFLLVLPLCAPALADDRFVQDYFRNLNSLTADFEQIVYDANGGLIQSSGGAMRMRKPGRFRWDYTEPFPQVVVADGERLWHYDSELEQVTVRRLDSALGATPLALLTGGEALDKVFTLQALAEGRGGLRWYELTPRQEQTEFNRLRVGFRDGELAILELEDAFGRLTRLGFQQLRRNLPVPLEAFEFEPPPGTDVIGDAG